MNTTNEQNEQRPQAGTPLPPIDPHLAAVWGAFLHEGMMLTSNNTERTLKLLNLWGSGCIELIHSVCEYIPILWEQVQPYWDQPQGFPGVFEYEVVSILGEQIATHLLSHEGSLPSDREFTAMAAAQVRQFFAQRHASQENDIAPTERRSPAFMSHIRALARCIGGEK